MDATGPFFFGPPGRRLFGWLHASPVAAGGSESPGAGVVLCNPFGFEAICMHRSLRHFAQAFARAGLPSLRFDYDGTGDSGGSDRDPERLRAWLDSIHCAVETLRARARVRQVYLLGVRLGAALAATAAAERADCAGLIALAPVFSPGLYLRELSAYQGWSRFAKPPDGVTGIGEGDQEASGFVITAATAAALSGIDLAKQSTAPASRVLLFERHDRPSTGAWAARLTSLGVDVDARRVPGFAEMGAEPHKAVVPEAMIAASLDWLTKSAIVAARENHEPEAPSGPAARTPVGMESELGHGVVETPIFVDQERRLFGVLTHPGGAERSGHVIILLNAGAQYRIGPSRLWVTLARHWSRMGALVLRLDLSGLGDSRPRPGDEENVPYTSAPTADVADAVAYLRREWRGEKFEAIGLCASAYQAFKAAVQGVAIDGVISINQQAFFWDPTVTVEVRPNKAASEVQRYRGAALNLESWKKLLRGEVKLRAASRIFRQRFLDLASSHGRRVARRLRVPLKNDLATELRTVAKRKVPLRFLFSEGEAGGQLLLELGGSTVGRLRRAGALTIETVGGADHTFTPVWTHRLLTERLDAWLGLPPERVRDARPPPESSLRRSGG